MKVNGGYHTAENSHRSRAVEAGMDVQVLAERRVELDRPERQILQRVAREIAWLLQHDMSENHDHEALATCGREICARLEGLANGEPPRFAERAARARGERS